MKRAAWIVVGLIVLGVGVWWFLSPGWPRRPGAVRDVTPTRTAIVPTLDTPIPKGKSALWCASFQMAWGRLKEDVAKGPVRLVGAEEATKRLNEAPNVEDTLEERDVYAAGGWVRDAIVEKIKRDMAARFPEWEVRRDLGEDAAAVAYAYLRAAVEFKIPFLDNPKPLVFSGVRVRSFGLPYSTGNRPRGANEQVDILHAQSTDPFRQDAFVIDPCKHTLPYQLLIAQIPRQPTLALLVADMERRTALGMGEGKRKFRGLDSFLVPELAFRIDHRFTELERPLLDGDVAGQRLSAFQRIEFRLDTQGARLKSEAVIPKTADPRDFICDAPFLVVMRKRGSTQPFLVLWVENDELLEPWD